MYIAFGMSRTRSYIYINFRRRPPMGWSVDSGSAGPAPAAQRTIWPAGARGYGEDKTRSPAGVSIRAERRQADAADTDTGASSFRDRSNLETRSGSG